MDFINLIVYHFIFLLNSFNLLSVLKNLLINGSIFRVILLFILILLGLTAFVNVSKHGSGINRQVL